MRRVLEFSEPAPAPHAEYRPPLSPRRLSEAAQIAAADRAAATLELPRGGLQGSVSREGTGRSRGGS